MRHTTEAELVLEQRVVTEALVLYGQDKQLPVAMEECAELIVAISHFMRGRGSDEELAGEVADVELICQTLRVIVGHDRVDTIRRGKVVRLANRVSASIEAAREAHDLAHLASGDAPVAGEPSIVCHGDEGFDVAEEPAT